MEQKNIVLARVLENECIAEKVYQMTLESVEVATSAKCGQFVNLYMKNESLLLPRPISICWIDGAKLTLVYGVVGKGTQELSTYGVGDAVKVSMPRGNGYDLETVKEGQTALLAGGGIGVPPLLELTYALTQKGVQVTAVIGFQEEAFLMKPLIKAGANLYVATDSGASGFHGNVVDLMKQEKLTADAYFACGPKPMLKALTEYVLQQGSDLQVSMEERMGCGYGACVGCVCTIRDKESGSLVRKKVCKDGPVFWGSEVVWDAK